MRPCPKCKATTIESDYLIGDGCTRDHPVRMKCSNCGYAEDFWSDSVEDAIERWDLRLLEDVLIAQLTEVTLALDEVLNLIYEHGSPMIRAHAIALLGARAAVHAAKMPYGKHQ